MATFTATLHERDPDNGYNLRRYSLEGHHWLAGGSAVVEKETADYLAVVRNGADGPLAFELSLFSGALEADPSFESYTEEILFATLTEVHVKGGRDTVSIHPAASSEGTTHFPGEDVVDLTDPAIDGGGQIFRASADSVHSAILRFGALGVTVTEDDFEAYADTAALRVAWTALDLGTSPHNLDEIIFADGAKSMRLTLKKNASNGDTWTKTFAPAEDWSEAQSIRFEARAENHKAVTLGIRIGDGANTATASFELTASLAWEEIVIPLAAFEADGASFPSLSAISSGAIVCVSCSEDGSFWVDGMVAAKDPGTVDLGIYEVDGPTPTELGAQVGETLTVELRNASGGLLEGQIHAKGLIFGEHYALLVSGTSTASLLGAVQDGYQNGHAFSLAGAVVTPLVGSALSFAISSDVPAKLDHVIMCFDADPLDAIFSIWILRIDGLFLPLAYKIRIHGQRTRTIEFDETSMVVGDLLFVEVQDDASSDVDHWAAEIKIRHPAFPSWG